MYVCMCVCTYVCMYVCMYASMHACMYVCMCVYVICGCNSVCMYACIYVCMCACMFAWTASDGWMGGWINVRIYLCPALSHHPTGSASIHPPIHPSIQPSIHPSSLKFMFLLQSMCLCILSMCPRIYIMYVLLCPPKTSMIFCTYNLRI